jgi:outer membrane protein TolC
MRLASALVIALGLLIAGCAPDTAGLAPPSPASAWKPTPMAIPEQVLMPSPPVTAGPANPNPEAAAVTIDPAHLHTLPELIDIAERNNPETRIAWQQARQAALAVGLGEATFLPQISATVIGGWQQLNTRVPVVDDRINTFGSGVIPAIGMQWLLFDFGQRKALVDAAKNVSYAANISFNGMHQKLIWDVTRTYIQYGAARSRVGIAIDMLRNSEAIRDAAEKRFKQGIATSVEVAQARQTAAQAKLRRIAAEGGQRDAYQALLGAMGVSPLLRIGIAGDDMRPLPATIDEPTEDMIRMALSQRPDVLASYANTRAAMAAVTAAQAASRPKVYVAGSIGAGDSRFNVEGFPVLGQQSSAGVILFGVSVPLYDGGLRRTREKEAQSRVAVSEEGFRKIRDVAIREIVVATDQLRTALEANAAASELVSAATITQDAAMSAYRTGVGNITAANIAANGLLEARQSATDARAGALIAAASLAFAMGEIGEDAQPDP